MTKLLDKVNKKLSFVGLAFGLAAGFLTRDEYYFNSQDRID